MARVFSYSAVRLQIGEIPSLLTVSPSAVKAAYRYKGNRTRCMPVDGNNLRRRRFRSHLRRNICPSRVHGARRLRAQQEAARRKRGSRPALDDDGLGFTSEFHPLDERLQRLGHDLLTRGAETIRTRRAGLALTNAAYALDAKIDRPVLESVRLGPFSHHHGRIDPSPIEQTASGLRSFEHRGRKRRMPPGRD